ncbi:MAG: inositol-3-phosphate synthase [Planctomycetota bacterium]|nr:inositol-3-phosphate synthase [Planctomycetota bacterium]MDA1223199.1 inositol-3-phosphate synthase [Planctomycetota bacterium]
MATRRRSTKRSEPERLGVWLFGALGGLATTVVVGARAHARGLTGGQGLLTETPLCDGVPLRPIADLVFGGHEIRPGTPLQAAREIHEQNGTIPRPILDGVKADLAAFGRSIRPGSKSNAGKTIDRLAGTGRPGAPAAETLREQIARLTADIEAFRRRNRLDRVVCVNLVSTEPALRLTKTHRDRDAFERALDCDQRTAVRPSTIYAYVAASLGLPFVHFTPSNGALIPAIRKLFEENGAPYAGADGKTGETLVKSALAPMFRYRNLRVLSWQGYNMLGDRDGVVLAEPENKASKVESKDRLLSQILGYPLHSKVAIDYVPSLGDLKTAWDFIHFEGFLGYRMSLQFTWQGCDSILAAPLVLDLIRLADLATRRSENGPLRHLACFFKSPIDVEEHDLHAQWHGLVRYLTDAGAQG